LQVAARRTTTRSVVTDRHPGGADAVAPASAPPSAEDAEAPQDVILHEDVADVSTMAREQGRVHVRKSVEHEHVEELVPRGIEQADVERVIPRGSDSGEIETLEDGSISVPVFEEELVITRRMVVRERIIVRKRTVTEEQRVAAKLRRERVEIEADPGVEVEGTEG
jgi:uncharacterized protein (TIGR02271 family)